MSDYELRINVYNSSKIGHANVSFYESDQHVYTIGANIRMQVPLLAVPKIIPFEPDDGIYLDETAFHAQAVETGIVTSAAVPITDVQYSELLSSARELEGQTFNYSVLTEACIELVEEFYEATGHPGEFGDLFAEEERSGSLVWTRVPVSDDLYVDSLPQNQPHYVPLEPFMPEPPVPQIPDNIVPPSDIPSIETEDAPPNAAESFVPDDTREPLRFDDIIDLLNPITLLSTQTDTRPEAVLAQIETPQVLLAFGNQSTGTTSNAIEPTTQHDVSDSLSIEDTYHLPMNFGTPIGDRDLDQRDDDEPLFAIEEMTFDSAADTFEFTPAEPNDTFGHKRLTNYAIEPFNERDALSFDDDHLPIEFGTAISALDMGSVNDTAQFPADEDVAFESSADTFESAPAEPNDTFDFIVSEPTVDLSYGDQVDESDLMDPLSVPTEVLGYSPKEFEYAGYEQTYLDYGTVI